MMMKSRSSYGATLLEIMLVLAVAAMVIVMSIRYYKNATNAQNANALLAQVQALTAAADNYAQGNGGSYENLSTSIITDIAGSDVMTTTYGTNNVVTSAAATNYVITMGVVPSAVCNSLKYQITANSRIASVTCTGGALKYTYTSTSD